MSAFLELCAMLARETWKRRNASVKSDVFVRFYAGVLTLALAGCSVGGGGYSLEFLRDTSLHLETNAGHLDPNGCAAPSTP